MIPIFQPHTKKNSMNPVPQVRQEGFAKDKGTSKGINQGVQPGFGSHQVLLTLLVPHLLKIPDLTHEGLLGFLVSFAQRIVPSFYR